MNTQELYQKFEQANEGKLIHQGPWTDCRRLPVSIPYVCVSPKLRVLVTGKSAQPQTVTKITSTHSNGFYTDITRLDPDRRLYFIKPGEVANLSSLGFPSDRFYTTFTFRSFMRNYEKENGGVTALMEFYNPKAKLRLKVTSIGEQTNSKQQIYHIRQAIRGRIAKKGFPPEMIDLPHFDVCNFHRTTVAEFDRATVDYFSSKKASHQVERDMAIDACLIDLLPVIQKRLAK